MGVNRSERQNSNPVNHLRPTFHQTSFPSRTPINITLHHLLLLLHPFHPPHSPDILLAALQHLPTKPPHRKILPIPRPGKLRQDLMDGQRADSNTRPDPNTINAV